MKDRFENTPIACSLTTTELRDREATLLAEFRSGVIETEELEDGYAFRLPGDGKWVGLIAELIVAERERCPFLPFELSAQPNMGPVIVRVTGPPGAKEFLRKVLCPCCMAHRPLNSSTPPSDALALPGHWKVHVVSSRKHKS